MNKSSQFYRKYAFIPIIIMTLAFATYAVTFNGPISSVIFMLSVIISISMILIAAVKFGELNIRGNIFYRNTEPVAFIIVFCIFSLLLAAGIVFMFWLASL